MPSLASQSPVLNREILSEMIDAVLTRPAAALLTPLTVKLFTAGPTPITPYSEPGDFTEATFPGYASGSVSAWASKVQTPNGEAVAGGASVLFTANAAGSDEVIQGYWVENDTVMLMGEYFETPVPMAQLGSYIDLLLLFALKFIPDTGA